MYSTLEVISGVQFVKYRACMIHGQIQTVLPTITVYVCLVSMHVIFIALFVAKFHLSIHTSVHMYLPDN